MTEEIKDFLKSVEAASKSEELVAIARKNLRTLAKEMSRVVKKYNVEFFDPSIRTDAVSEAHRGQLISPALAKDEGGEVDIFIFYLDDDGNVVGKKRLYEASVYDIAALGHTLREFFKAFREHVRRKIAEDKEFVKMANETCKVIKEIIDDFNT